MSFLSYINLIDLLFPNQCLVCNTRLPYSSEPICSDCREELIFLKSDICPKCGATIISNVCKVCSGSDFLFDKARSAFKINNVLKSLIHEFKYNEMIKVGKFLAELGSDYLSQTTPFSDVDIIIPAPLHQVKKRLRGYNQSQILTSVIGKRMRWKHIPNLVIRKQFTRTQTKLNRTSRQKNVANAFRINKKYGIENKNILIVDDVFTTGSTVNAITKVLKDNGVGKVYIFTIIRA